MSVKYFDGPARGTASSILHKLYSGRRVQSTDTKREGIVTAHHLLFAAVLHRAYKDLWCFDKDPAPASKGKKKSGGSRGTNLKASQIRCNAYSWIFSNKTTEGSFVWYCNLLHIDPEYFRMMAMLINGKNAPDFMIVGYGLEKNKKYLNKNNIN